MALTGTITNAVILHEPAVGDANLDIDVTYRAIATDDEAPWTVSVAALYQGNIIGINDTTHMFNDETHNAQVTLNIPGGVPESPIQVELQLWAHQDAYNRLGEYL